MGCAILRTPIGLDLDDARLAMSSGVVADEPGA